MTDHRLRCSASPQYQSRDLFVRKIPLPHRYNQITPFLCAPRNLYFLHFYHIIPHFYFYSNIPIHIVESDTNITTPTNHDVGDKRYFPLLIPDCYVLCTLASNLASAFWHFDPGIKSLYYYKSMTISCYNLKKLIFFVIGNDSRNALSDTIPI